MSSDQEDKSAAEGAYNSTTDGTDCNVLDETHLKCVVYTSVNLDGTNSTQFDWRYDAEVYRNEDDQQCYSLETSDPDISNPLTGGCFID